MKIPIVVLALTFGSLSAFAQEPVGCDKFKWPIDKERALLAGTGLEKILSGAEVAFAAQKPIEIVLSPFPDARLPMPPERAPKTESTFAGYVLISAVDPPGDYKINLSAEAWIDVIQDGRYVKSGPFSGVIGCEGIRKSVRFELSKAPFAVQLSGARTNLVRMVITPATD